MATPAKATKNTNNPDITKAKVYVTSTFNNTIVTVTDIVGQTIAWSSSGAAGFKGARRATPFAATMAVEQVSRKILTQGIKEVEVYIKGPGAGREASLRALKSAGLKLLLIADVTPIPHNGPRAPKPRRI